jgi:hypothetical protein
MAEETAAGVDSYFSVLSCLRVVTTGLRGFRGSLGGVCCVCIHKEGFMYSNANSLT